MKVKWLAVMGTVLVALAYVSMFADWGLKWMFGFAVGGVFLLLLELVRD